MKKHTKEECVHMAILGWMCAVGWIFMVTLSGDGNLLFLRILTAAIWIANAVVWTARAMKHKTKT